MEEIENPDIYIASGRNHKFLSIVYLILLFLQFLFKIMFLPFPIEIIDNLCQINTIILVSLLFQNSII